MAQSGGITIEEFERLPDALALNHELDDGELVDVSGNTPSHNTKRDFIVSQMLPHVRSGRLGLAISEQEFEFGGNAHGPDVAFICGSKLHLLDSNRRVQRFVPDLAIEIVSNNDKFNDIVKKAKRYRRYGTREVWVLDLANRQALVVAEDRQVILDDDSVFESKLIPGFSMPLAELFDWA
ncbi:MAG: Uma2 family endonuclease [Bryobacterales bacterium]|nr:Uma2 family endonuclease [Bryobacterales bacterium]MBV9399539.1 Uma2 family endonuclease [Bryobacterales bacterium]